MGFFNRFSTSPPITSLDDRIQTRGIADGGRLRATIALGGGGARGAAHLGVMQRVAETRLDVRRLVGVSMGALVGAMCAAEPDIHKVRQRAVEMLRSHSFVSKQHLLCGTAHRPGRTAGTGMFSWFQRLKRYVLTHHKCSRVVTGPALLGGELLREAVECLVPDIDIRDTVTPISIVAADLRSGQKIVLETGSLRTAVEASMAIPGVFPPVEHQGMLLCDIGAIDSLPIDIARSYSHDIAIGVDVSQAPSVARECSTALDVMVSMEEIGERMLRRKVLPEADLIIRPHVHGIAWFDFDRVETLIDAGYRAAYHGLPHRETVSR
jgi:NTE family protein